MNETVNPTPEPANQSQNETAKSSTGRTILYIILVIIGIGLVLLVGILLGQALGPRQGVDDTPPTVVVPTPAPDTPYAVANTAVNVRAGPGTNYPIYGVAQPGQSAEVVGKSPDSAWWTIKVPTTVSPDGQAWVSAEYTTANNVENVPVIEPPPPPPDITPLPPEGGSVTVVTTEPLNVRSGPNNSFPSYGKVHRGTTLEVVGVSQDGRWLAVSIPTSVSPDGIGWISAAYVEPTDINVSVME